MYTKISLRLAQGYNQDTEMPGNLARQAIRMKVIIITVIIIDSVNSAYKCDVIGKYLIHADTSNLNN